MAQKQTRIPTNPGTLPGRFKTIELFTFDELSEEAKEKARGWFRQGYDASFEHECLLDDAKTIGLKIISLDQHRANKGAFIDDAISCAQAIIKEHGEACETHKTAKSFLLSLDSLNVEHPEDEDGYRSRDYDDEKEELEAEFLESLLSDYWHMLDKQIDVDDNIRANGYTFREDGTREDA